MHSLRLCVCVCLCVCVREREKSVCVPLIALQYPSKSEVNKNEGIFLKDSQKIHEFEKKT